MALDPGCLGNASSGARPLTGNSRFWSYPQRIQTLRECPLVSDEQKMAQMHLVYWPIVFFLKK